jgi:leucyl aminopeptidase
MIALKHASAPKTNLPVLVPVFSDDLDPKRRKIFRNLSRAQKRAVRQVLAQKTFPKSGCFPVYSGDAAVLVLVTGKKNEADLRSIREAGLGVYGVANSYEAKEVQIAAGSFTDDQVQTFIEGVIEGSYEFVTFKGKKNDDDEKPKQKLETVHIVGSSQSKKHDAVFSAVAEGMALTKDIINTPPSDATPDYVQAQAEQLAKKRKRVSVKVFKRKDLEKLGCGGIVGVGRGSKYEPRLVILEYKGGASKEKPVALVGKGVTYDTGGHSLKPGQYMRGMKQDLGGAATVLGAFAVLTALGVKRNIIAALPVVENILSRDAYFPDDVLKMYNGLTVEVDNTDAEGRLILADALAYVEKIYEPQSMVNLATLTGAVFVAIGDDMAALLSNNKQLTAKLQKAAEAVGEPVWELPLHQRYKKKLESKIGNIVNCSSGLRAGTIEGGLFLQHFVTEKTPWCHMDIASVAVDKSDLATGRNVRLLVDYVTNRA